MLLAEQFERSGLFDRPENPGDQDTIYPLNVAMLQVHLPSRD